MKRFLLAALAAISLTPALAADLPVKAPPLLPANAFQFNGSGFFGGLFTEGGGGSVSANVPGVASASLTTTTAAIGLTAGWAFRTSSAFSYTLEGDVSATNFNGNSQGFALGGPLAFEQRAMIWAPASMITQALSFLNVSNLFGNLPTLNPNGATITNQMWGIGAGAYEKDVTLAYLGVGSNKVWSVEPVLTVMLQDQLSNGSAIRAFVKTGFSTDAVIVGAKNANAIKGPDVRAGVGFVF